MRTIADDALRVLEQVQGRLATSPTGIASTDDFLARIGRLRAELAAMIDGGAITEYQLEAAANELIETVQQHQALSEGSDLAGISTREERDARLARLEALETRPPTRAAKIVGSAGNPPHGRDQHSFLVNQMITRLDIIRNTIRT